MKLLVSAQDSDCPEKNGVFADSTQCDRYYECSNFVLTEKLCPDGLVFADLSTSSGAQGRCDYPFNVDCTDRPELRNFNYHFNHFEISCQFIVNLLHRTGQFDHQLPAYERLLRSRRP